MKLIVHRRLHLNPVCKWQNLIILWNHVFDGSGLKKEWLGFSGCRAFWLKPLNLKRQIGNQIVRSTLTMLTSVNSIIQNLRGYLANKLPRVRQTGAEASWKKAGACRARHGCVTAFIFHAEESPEQSLVKLRKRMIKKFRSSR
jgi:hypothetical protein